MLHSSLDWKYGVSIVTGDMGAGKSKCSYQDAFLFKWDCDILISNVPYDFVDIKFSTKEDLTKILNYLIQYMKDTNSYNLLDKEFPLITLLIDEAHNYFFARAFKENIEDMVMILTQCRKRNIKIRAITQELAQLDIVFRRLAPFVKKYKRLAFKFRRQELIFLRDPSCTDLEVPLDMPNCPIELQEQKIQIPDTWLLKFNKALIPFYKQKRLSNYVVAVSSIVDYDYENFLQLFLVYFKQLNGIPDTIGTDINSIEEFFKKQEEEKERENNSLNGNIENEEKVNFTSHKISQGI